MNLSLPSLAKPIRQDVPLAPFTTWKVGGPAEYLAEPTEEEAPALLQWARENGLPVHFLGRGSNTLIADEGLKGLVILTREQLNRLELCEGMIVAGAGISLPRLSKFAASSGYTGYEFLAGIPGTVGGGIVMNAGLTVFRPKEVNEIIDSFDYVDAAGEIHTARMEDVGVRYRHTDLNDGTRLVLRARFKLTEQGDPHQIHERTIEHLRERKSKQPLDKATAGSTFKSLPGSKGAGWYIEQAGLKALSVGAARISEKHANWIENTGSAKATDILELIRTVQEQVELKLGVHLEPEICKLGF